MRMMYLVNSDDRPDVTSDDHETIKSVLRANRRPGQNKFVKVPHYHYEYNVADHDIQDTFGLQHTYTIF